MLEWELGDVMFSYKLVVDEERSRTRVYHSMDTSRSIEPFYIYRYTEVRRERIY